MDTQPFISSSLDTPPIVYPNTPIPQKEPEPKKKSPAMMILLAITVILLGGIYGMMIYQESQKKSATTIATTTPTPSVTPIDNNRPLSAAASTSAFLQIEASSASLSAAIKALNMSDTTLNPPSLELPLGLQTN